MNDIAEGFARYLGDQLPDARDVSVTDVRRIHGGASRETYRLTAGYERAGSRVEQGMILRRDPKSGIIETQRATEFDAYTAFQETAVPVPRPLYLERESNEWLERPFFVMEEVSGCESDVRLFDAPPYAEKVDRIAEQKWRILGEIAKSDPEAIGLSDKMEAPPRESCWRRELDYWEGVVDEDELSPQPVFRAAVRRLRAAPPPPPARIGVVHGDYRSGNFLFDEAGDVRAILDWEMCHLGDPLEDLAWALNPLWGWPNPEKPGRLVTRATAIAHWQSASGLEIDPDALWWWETFSSVKGLAIWISSSREYFNGTNTDPIMIFPSWYCIDIHNRVLVDRLAPEGKTT